MDCLHDWRSHVGGTDDLAIIIDNADGPLHADFLGILVSVLRQATWMANLQLDADGNPDNDHRWTPRALHAVFLLDRTPPAAFADGATSDLDNKVVVDDGRLLATLTGPDWLGGRA